MPQRRACFRSRFTAIVRPQSSLVASGTIDISSGAVSAPIAIAQENSSGLSGSIAIASATPIGTIELGVVPLVTSWQLQTLRSGWLTEDHPSDPFTDGTVATAWTMPSATTAMFPAPVHYDPTGFLICGGVMSPDALSSLLGLTFTPPLNATAAPLYATAIKTLYVQSQRSPVFDPDVVGPDDFRDPTPHASGGAEKPFDLWLRRRNWTDQSLLFLQQQQTPGGIANVLAAMTKPWVYHTASATITIVSPWSASTPVASFETLWENLAETGPGIDPAAVALQLNADLGLTVDAFNRLMDIWRQDQAARVDPRNPAVTPDAWNELRSLLVQSIKVRLFPAWRDEETALPLVFGSQDFVVSMHEPAVGLWPLLMPAGQPFIDPILIGLNDLPEPTAGAGAIKLWNDRSSAAATRTIAIRQAREQGGSNGFAAALQTALGGGLPDLNTLAAQLLDPTHASAAAATIQSALFMSVDDFTALMAIRAAAADANPLAWPTPAQWDELYAILTAAQTKKSLYPGWLAAEQNAGLTYWTARRAALPLWRASVDARAQWLGALAQRSGPPIVDPDILNWGDFVEPLASNPAFTLWDKRTTWVGNLPPLRPTPPPLQKADIDKALLASLGVDQTALLTLGAQSNAGTDITAALAQLGLSFDAFEALVGVITLVASGMPLLASEVSDFNAILVQVAKERQFAAWQIEEANAKITLGPDFFQPWSQNTNGAGDCACPSLQSTPQPPPLLAWRATPQARQAWEDTLNSRINQQSTTIAAIENVVDAAEGATLTQLRNILINATAPGGNLATLADGLTAKLMIDTETGGCQKTTRIEQAVETLQTIMTSVRNGQIGSFDLPLQSSPAATSGLGGGRIEVFAQGPDGALWHKWREPTGGLEGIWHDWELFGGNITSAPVGRRHHSRHGGDIRSRCRQCAVASLLQRADRVRLEFVRRRHQLGAGGCLPGGNELRRVAIGSDGGVVQFSGGFDAPSSTYYGGLVGPVARNGPSPGGGTAQISLQPTPFYWPPAVGLTTTGDYDLFVLGGDSHCGIAPSSMAPGRAGRRSADNSRPRRRSSPVAPELSTSSFATSKARFPASTTTRSRVDGRHRCRNRSAATSMRARARRPPRRRRASSTPLRPAATTRFGAIIGTALSGAGLGRRRWADDQSSSFDEEWSWMGSYATWRAAILGFMYPQNILDPTLRNYQTPGFQKLVATVQGNAALTPDQACQAACNYASYYHDVCTMTIGASLQAETLINIVQPCGCGTPDQLATFSVLHRARRRDWAASTGRPGTEAILPITHRRSGTWCRASWTPR